MATDTWIELPAEGGVISLNGATGAVTIVGGSGISVSTVGTTITVANTGSSGSVTSVSVVSANGFSGVVANPTTTPAITLTGTLTGDITGTLDATTLSDTVATSKLLTGYSVGANTPITATDSILTAFEKTQGQINSIAGSPASVVIPTVFTNSTTAVTSSSTTFVTAITQTLTISNNSPIYSRATFDLQATTAAVVAQVRITINGVAGPLIDCSIDNTTDHLVATTQYESATLAPGTYTITAQIARLSGTGTVSFFQGSLFSQAQQGLFSINNPSNIIYVATNGLISGATGSFTNPYPTISAAVTAANTLGNVVIAVAPGSYSDAAPVSITGSNIYIVSMTQNGTFTGDNRTQNDSSVKYSGSFIYAPTANFVVSGLSGIEVDIPAGTAWNTNPYAVTVLNSHQNKFYISDCVLKASNLATRGALQVNGASQVVQVMNSLLLSGTTTGPNISPISLLSGHIILYESEVTDIQTSNAGTTIQNSAVLTTYGGILNGAIIFNSAVALWDAYAGTVVNSGANVCVQTYSSYLSGYFTGWDCVLNTSNTTAINGIQIVYIGVVVYGNGYIIAPTVNNGAGMPESQFLFTDSRAKYYEPNPSNWATSVPLTNNDALNRMAALLKTLNGGTPIP